MEISQVYKTIDTIIASFKKARHDKDYLTLMSNGLALLEYLPSLINYSVEQEAEYRKFESNLSDQKDEFSKRLSSSYCETKAKATDYYKEWQRAKNFIELIYELVQISKKLAGSIDLEMRAS